MLEAYSLHDTHPQMKATDLSIMVNGVPVCNCPFAPWIPSLYEKVKDACKLDAHCIA